MTQVRPTKQMTLAQDGGAGGEELSCFTFWVDHAIFKVLFYTGNVSFSTYFGRFADSFIF